MYGLIIAVDLGKVNNVYFGLRFEKVIDNYLQRKLYLPCQQGKERKEKAMYYTIATTKQVQGNLKVDLGKNGNRYFVHLYNEDTEQLTKKDFANMDDAFSAFSKIGEIVVKNLYREDQKREMLLAM